MKLYLQAIISLIFTISSIVASPLPETFQQRQGCSDVYVYFARGTTEIGTLGSVVGPPFRAALQGALGSKSLVFEGIDYPAIIAGYLAGSDIGGGIAMANRVTRIADQCPNAKIVISGYSQGAQVTHIAANRLSTPIQNRINAVLTFGDPYENTNLPGVLQSRRKTFCNVGDLICSGLAVVLAPHLTYGIDTPEAARFVASRV